MPTPPEAYKPSSVNTSLLQSAMAWSAPNTPPASISKVTIAVSVQPVALVTTNVYTPASVAMVGVVKTAPPKLHTASVSPLELYKAVEVSAAARANVHGLVRSQHRSGNNVEGDQRSVPTAAIVLNDQLIHPWCSGR